MLTLQTSGFTSRLAQARWPVLVLAVVWLGGCAMAPGLTVGRSLQKTGQWANPDAGTSRTGTSTANQTPPPATLLAITPELITQQRALRKAELSSGVKRLFAQAQPYGIGPGDVINIVVWNHPELVLAPAGATLTTDASGLASVGNGYNVSPEGLIQFPLLGTFKIAGLTESAAREELTRRLSRFIKNPQITLRIQAYRAGRVYVDGEVRTPGLQAINDIPMTLPEAINRAGGLTPAADRAMVAVTRDGVTSEINLPQLTTLGVNPSRIMLAAGDLVRVASREDAKVYVLGEVTTPRALPLRNGSLTLNEALGESGGVNPASGDPRQIYVVRSRSGDSATATDADAGGTAASAAPATPEIYHLDASSPAAYALAEGFELKSRDVVFVDPVPLVLWNRVISLVLPSAQVVNLSRNPNSN
ncbi:polysaccharide biosynthesis/export family protein [Polaromonas naphthalenivorans]|uniref:Polysaccharide export protein n=1 Tax=Polaromonas naphthalenivorans (strain CJ2) TaxID=365044 RepID=A1VS03_POLNA|nr:polysaccharide biosynthesis/export family protein [Polaromonas naphthalenivorans]ABM38431.1 polysaccharide export protein [Polaromonas naphthalenivorans CJ2]